MPSPLPISIVIPTYNRQHILSRTLPTVFSQDFPADQYEVIVVVDGATDGTVEMLRALQPACSFQVLEQPNRGQAAARNTGWRAARGELVLFLDDDLFCDPFLLREHLTAHKGADPLVVLGPTYFAPESPRTTARAYMEGRDSHWTRLVTERAAVERRENLYVGGNSSVPRSVLLTCGGFDERFACTREDADLGLRLCKMGLPFQVQAAAVTTELYAKPADALVNLAASHARSEFLLCQKHPEYRPYSALARIERKPLRNRVLRQAAARLPVSPEPLLRVLFQIADRLRSVPGIERLAVRLLGYRISVAFWRSAAQEAGSWQTLREQFGAPTPVPKPADIPSKLV